MSDYKFIIKADEINGGLEGFEVDEETKAGYECDGFACFISKGEGYTSIMQHVNTKQMIAWIMGDKNMMMAAKMAVMMQAVSGNKGNSIEKLFGLEG